MQKNIPTPKDKLIKEGLLLEKIIYAKRTAFDKQQLVSVLELEIQSHKIKFPHLECTKINEPIKLQDRSMLYSLEFERKKVIK